MLDVSDLIGIPYVEFGRDKNGFDCYGLVLEIYKRLGISLPDYVYKEMSSKEKNRVYQEAIIGIKNIKLNTPKEHCLILMEVFGEPTHIGVYLNNGKFIHCIKNGGVVIDKIIRWQHRIRGFYEVCNN